MTPPYKDHLVKTIAYLIEVKQEIFGHSLNLAMAGELKDIDKAFDIGDTYEFELTHLEDLKDPNVQKLAGLFREIEQTIDTLENINNLKKE